MCGEVYYEILDYDSKFIQIKTSSFPLKFNYLIVTNELKIVFKSIS